MSKDQTIHKERDLISESKLEQSAALPVSQPAIDKTQLRAYTELDLEFVAYRAAEAAIRLLQSKKLDNDIQSVPSPESEQNMKIRRKIIVFGKESWINACSEQEYFKKIAALLGERRDEPKTRHNFKSFADNWFETYNKPNISTAAALTNERQLRLYIYPQLGDKDIEDITSDDVQKLFNSMGQMKKSSKDKTKNVLNMIFNLAVDKNIILKNPLSSSSLRLTGSSSEKIPAYSVEDMKFFVSSLPKVKDPSDRAWFALMLFHPLRPEECLGLKYKNIFVADGVKVMKLCATVTHPTRCAPVYAEKMKTDQSLRVLQIAPAALPYIPDGDPEHFVVGGETPMSYTMCRHMCQRIAKDIGYDGKIIPRRFRTTVASDLYAVTHDEKLVQNSLGHSKHSATAMNHYIESRQHLDQTGTLVQSVYLS